MGRSAEPREAPQATLLAPADGGTRGAVPGFLPARRSLRGVDGLCRQGRQLGSAQLPLLSSFRAARWPARAGFLRRERAELSQPDRLRAVLPDGFFPLAQCRGIDCARRRSQLEHRAALPPCLEAICPPARTRSSHSVDPLDLAVSQQV